MTQILPIEPFGLRLVLGGGVRLVSRGEGIAGSTTILVRGAPGTGKTVLGLHIATAIASLLHCDVAYGCVEILPPELAAIVEGLDTGFVVESAPFKAPLEASGRPRILAGLLDIGERGLEQKQLPGAVEDLIHAASAAGSTSRVVVLDSLSDGYGLGATVPRGLADEMCKMAAGSGRIFVLLEEAIDSTPSPWCFAADVVLELSLRELGSNGGPLVRWMSVLKNRFGAAEPGPHQMVIREKEGVSVRPSARTYLRSWAAEALFRGRKSEPPSRERWGAFGDRSLLPCFEESTIFVGGIDAYHVAARLGETQALPSAAQVWLRIGGKSQSSALGSIAFEQVPLWDPLSSPDDLLARSVGRLVDLHHAGYQLRRIVVGDLTYLREDPNERNLREFLTTFAELVRHLAIPLILFQVSGTRDAQLLSLADVLVSVEQGGVGSFTLHRTSVVVKTLIHQMLSGALAPLTKQLSG